MSDHLMSATVVSESPSLAVTGDPGVAADVRRRTSDAGPRTASSETNPSSLLTSRRPGPLRIDHLVLLFRQVDRDVDCLPDLRHTLAQLADARLFARSATDRQNHRENLVGDHPELSLDQ